MTPAETAELLTLAAAFDRRTIGKADVMAWHAALADHDLDDAREALIEHYRETRDWLMPADLIAKCRTRRADRIARNLPMDLPPGIDPDDTLAVQRATRDQRRAAATRQTPPQVAAIAAALHIDRAPAPRCEHGVIRGLPCASCAAILGADA